MYIPSFVHPQTIIQRGVNLKVAHTRDVYVMLLINNAPHRKKYVRPNLLRDLGREKIIIYEPASHLSNIKTLELCASQRLYFQVDLTQEATLKTMI